MYSQAIPHSRSQRTALTTSGGGQKNQPLWTDAFRSLALSTKGAVPVNYNEELSDSKTVAAVSEVRR